MSVFERPYPVLYSTEFGRALSGGDSINEFFLSAAVYLNPRRQGACEEANRYGLEKTYIMEAYVSSL